MKGFKLKLATLAMFGCLSAVHASNSNYQLVGTIEFLEDGTIKVYTTENDTKWGGTTGCNNVDQYYMQIGNSTTARDKWLSMLLLAKTSGIKVRVHYSSCPNGVMGNATELNLQ